MKKQIISGLVGVAALLLTTAAFAANATCTSGTITAVGSGDVNAATKVGASLIYKIRWIDVTCDDNSLNGRYYLHPTTDEDGKYATALAAASDGKKVSYTVYTGGVWCVVLNEIP